MAHGPRYKVPFRRRRMVKTDFHQRLRLLRSRKPRLVVRRTGRQIIAQLIITEITGDKTVVSATSKDLRDFGYEGAPSNTPAAYLIGYLAAKRALEGGFEEAILDIGLRTSRPGARVYAALKGAVDAGLEIPHSPDVFPSEERIRGEHIAEYDEKFEGLPENFDEALAKINEEFEE